MASVISLGAHAPSALQYLVAEGILRPDPPPSSYSWQTFSSGDAADNQREEELLTTKTCVVWSKGGTVQKLFRFDIENEPVNHAVFARFTDGQLSPPSGVGDETPPLIVPKKRSKLPGNETKASSATPTGHRATSDHKKPETPPLREEDRAIAVFLKTQAHVYFLSGTNHLVHLPFDVAAVFPLPSGLVIQRRVHSQEALKQTPHLPSVPFNSFALSQSTSSGQPPLQVPDVGDDSVSSDCPPIIASMLKSVLGRHGKAKDSDLPAHFYLSDPLAEMSVLVESVSPLSSSRGASQARVKKLDHNEEMIYLSTKNELSDTLYGIEGLWLSLAVTVNRSTGQCSIWKVSKIPLNHHANRGARFSSKTLRRKSSFGPGTGATTPAARTSIGPRESFGNFKGSAQEQNYAQNDGDLASQLDPAFENPAAPAKSSRRISSLLARSELSGNRDPSNYTDLTSAAAQGLGIKRGPSFAGHSLRKSSGLSFGYQERARRAPSSSHTDLEANGHLEPSMNDLTDESDSDSGSATPTGKDFKRNTFLAQEDMSFTKLYAFGGANSTFRTQSSASLAADPSIDVFTLTPPLSSPSPHDICQLILCIMDRNARKLYVLQISVSMPAYRRHEMHGTRAVDARITDMKIGENVVDACKIFDGFCSRIVVLERTGDGASKIALQSPWSTMLNITLPTTLFTVNPFQADRARIMTLQRDGGFKKVYTPLPHRISRLGACYAPSQFDIHDDAGNRHRLQLRLSPESSFVARAIRVCEYVSPAQHVEREPVLRAWWDIMAGLSHRSEFSENMEWRSFVVVIFSMFIGFLQAPKVSNPIRTKRKGALLRSSSGAYTDLGNFEEMMKLECTVRNPAPPWLHNNCWGWISETKALSAPPPSSKAKSRKYSPNSPSSDSQQGIVKKGTFIRECVDLAREFSDSELGRAALGHTGFLPTAQSISDEVRRAVLPKLLLALHLLREELKLDLLQGKQLHGLTPVLAQLGGWLGWESWGWRPTSYYMLESDSMEKWSFDESAMRVPHELPTQEIEPPSILEYMESTNNGGLEKPFPTLDDISTISRRPTLSSYALKQYTPKTSLLMGLLQFQDSGPCNYVRIIGESGLDVAVLDTLPEGVAAPLRSVIASCQTAPGSSLSAELLELVDRNDISLFEKQAHVGRPQYKSSEVTAHDASRDFHSIGNSTLETEQVSAYDGSAEMDRQAVTRMIFKDDQRFSEAARVLHPLKPAEARCVPEPDWSDTDLLEAQQELAKIVATRTLSVSPGRSMIFYSARFPLLTEKFPIHGFSLSCVMKPGNTTVTADKNIYTEEKVSWAFFHAGVEAGLTISRDAAGINTSWILYNKPAELTNRHAGFLLALGLNGHLKSIAKWVAFKYLTPKHTMTSIGLLLGLSASYLGTMDTLITRLLSVHVTRMLPPGAAELNLSPLTQTTGIMAIGLLYCNTQHRRMSEIMLSEIENVEQDDTISPMENLRDEGYRLAAGFALGYINLGQGRRLKGLRDMRIVERLLSLAVATKRVDLVHILDKATAGATVAVGLIFMKTEDEALARKVDIPDTVHQFEYVRPDIFLLRTVAKNLIMWKSITPSFEWIVGQLPPGLKEQAKKLDRQAYLHSEQLPLFNIIAGLCLSIGLRYAGTAQEDVRDVLCHYIDCFMKITSTPGTSYDEKLTRITARNCQDVIALAAACVMAGTGDLRLLRRFRVLHGRTDPDTPYGSHMAAHQAIGVLFLGGGTHTFNTSNIAVASLLCAFYPLFPMAVLDNQSHLQAFRHFWVLASEPRCLVVRSVETQRPMNMQIRVVLRSGEEQEYRAPCLLPELDSIAMIASNDPQYWPVTIDFAGNAAHLAAFKRHQSMYVRRRAAYEASATVFGSTMKALNEAQAAHHQLGRHAFDWIWTLPALRGFGHTDRALVLPADRAVLLHNAPRNTSVDDRLSLERASLNSGRAERLWNLRVLFAWAEKTRRMEGELNWLGREVIGALRAQVALMARGEP